MNYNNQRLDFEASAGSSLSSYRALGSTNRNPISESYLSDALKVSNFAFQSAIDQNQPHEL